MTSRSSCRRSCVLLLLMLSSISIGCVGMGCARIALDHDELETRPQSGRSVRMQVPVRDLREHERIGRATITAFAITSGSIHTDEAVEHEVADEIEAGLQAAGFQVERVSSDDAPPGSIAVSIHEFSFSNYNWFFPVVPTSGTIEIGLTVRSEAGELLFEQRFEGSGNSMCLTGECGFGGATRAAMTEALQQLIVAAQSPEFVAAVGALP